MTNTLPIRKKAQNKLAVLFFLLIFLGSCDSLEDKKGRFLLKGNEKLEENDPKSAIGFYREAIALDSTDRKSVV